MSNCQKPPTEEFNTAKAKLLQAQIAEAPRYAKHKYHKAETLLNDSQMEIARQNGHLFILRNYSRAESLTSMAYLFALVAAIEGQENKLKLRNQVLSELSALRNELTNWRAAFNGSLILYKAEHFWSSADLSLKSCEVLTDQEEFDEALREAKGVRSKLQELSKIIEEYTNKHAEKTNTWRQWVNKAIYDSRNLGSIAIVVVKSTHKLYLIHKGEILQVFDCELGYNSANQKYFAGDGATPEGTYRITRINHSGSKYYKALLLNYPNETDKKRFVDNKAKGIISKHARIGALIEIHGHGGQNTDWTDGCVALANNDMDTLIKHVSVGTPITIVRFSDQWP